MFYLQITTKCNMRCAHCCFACTNKGEHMSLDVATQAILFASKWDSYTIDIGGGEPTLNPNFFKILGRAVNRFEYVWMATNGSRTKTMMRLARIINDNDTGPCPIHPPKEGLRVTLSLDRYHDPIHRDVQHLWETEARHSIFFDIRRTQSSYVSSGRALENKLPSNGRKCACDEPFIKPDGSIRLCGCADAPVIGNVLRGIDDKWIDIINNGDFEGCYKSLTESKEEKEVIENYQENSQIQS